MATANPTALFTTLPRTEFIQKNLGLVHSCAGRFTGRGIEYEELYSAGCLGLVKAGELLRSAVRSKNLD